MISPANIKQQSCGGANPTNKWIKNKTAPLQKGEFSNQTTKDYAASHCVVICIHAELNSLLI